MKRVFILLLFISFATLYAQVKVSSRTIVNPVFIRAEKNIVQTITAEITGSGFSRILDEIIIETGDKLTRNYLKSVKIFLAGEKNDSLLVMTGTIKGNRISLIPHYKLIRSSSTFKIGLEIKDGTPLDKFIKIKCPYIKISGEKYPVDKLYSDFRAGYCVRRPNDDSVKCYRIPGLAVSNKGTLLAIYDIRRKSAKDLPGDIDVGLSRSTDNGQTWEPMKTIIDITEPAGNNGEGDASILVDKNTGTIWVAAFWAHGNIGWNTSKQGMTPEETGQIVLVKSSDDGITWSKPSNITPMVKNPSWHLFFQAPGNGITLNDGTLVFPAQFRDSAKTPHSTIIYSKDNGLTWKTGTGAKSNTTESQIVQLQNGTLMLNMRDDRGGARSIAVTTDLGTTWIEHNTSRSALIESVCMASFIRVNAESPGIRNSLLAFSNPDSRKNRDSLTIKFSTDEGERWDKIPSILVDERNSYGYSCLTKIDEEYLGLLYEGKGEIYFVKIKIPEKALRAEIDDFLGQTSGSSVIRGLTKKDNNKTIAMHRGSNFTVTLKGNPTTGYTWKTAPFDSTIISPENKYKYKPSGNLAGSPGEFIFNFRGINRGVSAVKFYYMREWEKNTAPADSFKVIICID